MSCKRVGPNDLAENASTHTRPLVQHCRDNTETASLKRQWRIDATTNLKLPTGVGTTAKRTEPSEFIAK